MAWRRSGSVTLRRATELAWQSFVATAQLEDEYNAASTGTSSLACAMMSADLARVVSFADAAIASRWYMQGMEPAIRQYASMVAVTRARLREERSAGYQAALPEVAYRTGHLGSRGLSAQQHAVVAARQRSAQRAYC